MSSAFRYYVRVRYSECDAQKVVFNSSYSDFVDLSATEFLRVLGFHQQLVSGELDYQVVKQTIEWKAPARFDQVLEISVTASKVGNTSFILAAVFRIAGSEAVIVTAETVYVLVDTHTLTKRPIPNDLRAALTAGTDAVTDHGAWFTSLRRR